MSFGFGPGDIVALVTFSKKVYDALEKEEGSQIQYRRAVKQCDAFATAINQVKRVDLTHFPTDFRQELEEIYTNAAEHITLFRKNTIDKYEKSLGKGTKRGLFATAPRKVQWAFGAAEDLEELRQSLSSWLSAIQMCITTNIFERSLLNEGPFPAYYALPGPPVRSLTLPQLRQEPPLPRQPLYLNWTPPAAQHLEMERTVSLVSDLVYKRLLSKPGLAITEAPKVFTLGPGNDAEATFLQAGYANEQITPDPPQLHPSNHGERTRSHSPANEHDETTAVSGPNIVDDTNSYLQDMRLPPLTASEAASLLGRDNDPHISTQGKAPIDQPSERSRSYNAGPSSKTQAENDMPPHPSSRTAGSPFVTSALVGTAAKLAYQLRVSDRVLQPHFEILQLCGRLTEYVQLLRHVGDVLPYTRSSASPGYDAEGFGSTLEYSYKVILRIFKLMQEFFSARGLFGGAVDRLAWKSRRRRIMAMVAEVDGLKANLLIMLQVAQMENDRSAFKRVEASCAHSLALLRHFVATQNSRVDSRGGFLQEIRSQWRTQAVMYGE